MKNVCLISYFLFIQVYSFSQWQQLGSSYLTSSITSNHALVEDDEGNLYAAFQPFTDNFLYVKKFDLGNWNQVGSSASTEPVSQADMCIGSDGLPVVVYRNYNDSVVVRKFNGTIWETIGSGPFAKGDYPRIEVNSENTIHVVFNNKAVFPWGTSVYKFEGGAWGPLHAQYIENLQAEFTDLAFDSNDLAVVSFRRASTGRMSVYRSDGNSWQAAGNTQFTPDNVFYGRLILDNNDIPYITFTDPSTNHRGSIMVLNGANWEYFGSPNFTGEWVDYCSTVFDGSNVPHTVYNDGTTRLMRYDGTSWVQVGLSPGNGNDHHLILNQFGNPVVSYTNISQNYNLIVKQFCTAISVDQNVAICNGDVYEIGGQEFSAPGNYQINLIRTSGCDSLVNLTLTLLPVNSSNQEVSICAGEVFQVGAASYTESGVYTNILQSVSGCDSLVTTQLSVIPTITSQQEITICFGESFQVGTTVLSSPGIYSTVIQAASGCDSIVTTNLNILDNILTTQEVDLCSGESIQVGLSVYSAPGTYTDILMAVNGCDSTVITAVNVQTPIVTTISILPSTLIADQAGATYQWIDCSTQNPIQGETNQSFSPLISGDYAVEIIMGFCSTISDCISFDIAEINEFANLYRIYPNPTNGVVMLEGAGYDDFKVVDLTGRVVVVSNFIIDGSHQIIDLSPLDSGRYILELFSNEGQYSREIILKR